MAVKDSHMHRYSMFLSKPLLDALKAKAAETETSVSEHIRASLIQYLGFNAKPTHESVRENT